MALTAKCSDIGKKRKKRYELWKKNYNEKKKYQDWKFYFSYPTNLFFGPTSNQRLFVFPLAAKKLLLFANFISFLTTRTETSN